MATVTSIANRVCRYSGLATVGNDRTLVLEFLNDIYKDAIQRSNTNVTTSASITLTAGTHTYTLSSAPFSLTDVERIQRVVYSGSNSNVSLRRVSPAEMRDMRSGLSVTQGSPSFYCSPSPGKIMFYPTPVSGDTCIIDYVQIPPTLVESGPVAGEETTPSAIPDRFHHNILSTGGIASALDSDQNADADRWWSKYEMAIADLQAYVNEYGGDRMVDQFWGDWNTGGSTDRGIDY